jgi:hypothetical protein
VIARKLFTLLRTTEINTEITGKENGGSQKVRLTANKNNVFYHKPHSTPQQDIQEISLSVQALSSIKNDTLQATTVVQQIMTELNEALSQAENIVITRMVLNLIKEIGC